MSLTLNGSNSAPRHDFSERTWSWSLKWGAFGIVAAVLFSAVPPGGHAQESLSVTVTPPLFQLSIGPGEQWRSSIRVVNNNNTDVAYYATVMDFEGEGEEGMGRFVPLVTDETDPERYTYSLASWMEVPTTPIMVRRGTSSEVPFTIRIPADAEPGGHSAAILIGTQPPGDVQADGPLVQISSFVSSLFFVRIHGEVIEQARIREFRTDKTLYETPTADFVLRFENLGNVHLRPQGDITIYNMWGKERGRVEINHRSAFGNVLPESIRRFEFAWEGEPSVFDIGRYSARVVVGYGQDAKQTIHAVAYFWVVPIVPLAATLGVVMAFITTMTWFIRRYIRRALALEQRRHGYTATGEPAQLPEAEPIPAPFISAPTVHALVEPFREGVIDLRAIAAGKRSAWDAGEHVGAPSYEREEAPQTLAQFLRKYQLFLIFLLVLAMAIVGTRWYMGNVLVAERDYKITEISAEAEGE